MKNLYRIIDGKNRVIAYETGNNSMEPMLKYEDPKAKIQFVRGSYQESIYTAGVAELMRKGVDHRTMKASRQKRINRLARYWVIARR